VGVIIVGPDSLAEKSREFALAKNFEILEMPDQTRKPIVFTDLDGTLLDHNTYGYGAVVPLLEKLKENQKDSVALY
jgi:trehalose-6-phosphatase